MDPAEIVPGAWQWGSLRENITFVPSKEDMYVRTYNNMSFEFVQILKYERTNEGEINKDKFK